MRLRLSMTPINFLKPPLFSYTVRYSRSIVFI